MDLGEETENAREEVSGVASELLQLVLEAAKKCKVLGAAKARLVGAVDLNARHTAAPRTSPPDLTQ